MTGAAGIGRRGFLGGAATVGAAIALAGCDGSGGETGTRAESRTRGGAGGFAGPRQVGIAEPSAAFGLMASFRCVDPDRPSLARTLQALSGAARRLVDGRPAPQRARDLPPTDTGVLGADHVPVQVTVAVGASLFDRRYGLGDRRPRELVPMPFLANDRLDPARTSGDLLLTLAAGRPDACLHALRQLMRATRSGLVLHWVLDGYNRPDAVHVPGRTGNRNLLGFKDGTANLDVTDDEVMDRYVWVGADRNDGAEPAWTVGGSYQVVRVIRMFVEQWDRASLGEQERIIGRRKASGAPLDGARETDDPDFSADPQGRRTPLDAHIRLARPRTAATEHERILRKGFSYSHGHDRAGTLDQGLAFVSYQRRLATFLAVQRRLSGEPLEEYTQTEGGGFFFVLPGAGADGWLGESLLA